MLLCLYCFEFILTVLGESAMNCSSRSWCESINSVSKCVLRADIRSSNFQRLIEQ